jgi:hypothetical protein
MARQVTWGTPGRSKHYIKPRPAFVMIGVAGILSAAIAFLLMTSHAVGFRSGVSPGKLISAHAPIETACEECHAPRSGASNPRCQRCHDAGGAGRLSNSAHVLFGSGDAKKAAAAPDRYCASCHVEHRGRDAALSTVNEVQCIACHFRGLQRHPEFAVLRQKSVEVPGIKYPHDCHVREIAKKGSCKDTAFDPGPAATAASCSRCHEPQPGGRDLLPVTFDRHCASCHLKDGSVGSMDPVPQDDALSIDAIRAQNVQGDWVRRGDNFEVSRGKVTKAILRHEDEWVLFNMWKLRRELDPAGYATERGALLARASQLQRRLALAAPLASLDLDALRARQASIELEIQGLVRRIGAQGKAVEPAAGLARLNEVLAAAVAAGDDKAKSEAQSEVARADELRKKPIPAGALASDVYDQRRKELLSALDAIESADPRQKRRTEDLRRRVLAVAPSTDGTDLLARVRDQRRADLQRVQDEIKLREGGLAPPRSGLLAGEQRLVQNALDAVQERLRRMSEGPPPPANLSPEERERKKGSLDSLLSPCLKCHLAPSGSLASVSAARPVLVRATFAHAPHLLQADCARCHPSVGKSQHAEDLNFKGIASCRECHGSGRSSQDCQSCHNYHPPAAP